MCNLGAARKTPVPAHCTQPGDQRAEGSAGQHGTRVK
jgi:hypothetical protein